MDEERLVAALRQAIKDGAVVVDHGQSRGSVLNPMPNSDANALARFVRSPPEATSRVEELLRQEPQLAIFNGGAHVAIGSEGRSSCGCDFPNLAFWLIGQAVFQGPETIARQFADFVRENRAEFCTAHGLVGIAVDNPVQLANKLELVPFDSLPPSHGRASVRERAGNPFNASKHMAILLRREIFGPVLTKPIDNSTPVTPEQHRAMLESAYLFADTIRCMTLVGPRCVIDLGSWAQALSPGVPALGGGSGWHELSRGLPRSRATPLDVDELNTVIKSFFALPQSTREALRTAIDRLNLAVGGRDVADVALDLGVALEAALLHDVNPGMSEYSYRLRLRGAVLLGGTKLDRTNNYKLLRQMYDLRSKAVHEGTLSSDVKHETMAPGLQICARLIRRIISGGGFLSSAEWDDLLLGNTGEM